MNEKALIAGLLQKMGVSAGVMMVNRGIAGQESNNGHAVCMARLRNGKDVIVDASEPKPFARQKGLFTRQARTHRYVYVEPLYESGTGIITSYTAKADGGTVRPSELGTLDVPFLRSMFDYYRGERTPGGLMVGAESAKGLQASARFLESAIRQNRNNPLPHYLLGRIYAERKQWEPARAELEQARHIYLSAGWTPRNWRDAFAQLPAQRPRHRVNAAGG